MSASLISRKTAPSFFQCISKKDKIVTFFALALVALLFAVVFEGACYAFLGAISTGSWFNPYRFGFVLVALLLVSCFFIFRHDVRSSPENLFLCITLFLTCYCSLAIDVNEPSWDVGLHYRFAIELSSPDLSNELSLSEEAKTNLQYNRIETSISELDEWQEALDQGDSVDFGASIEGARSTLYQRVASLPASIITALLTFFGASFSVKYVAARLIYAFIYSFVTYLGMRLLKSGKMLYAVIAMLPTAIFLASNYSYDYWINAFALLGVAGIVGMIQSAEGSVSVKRAMLPIVAFVVGFGPKAIYFPICLLCLLVPRSRFKTNALSKWYRFTALAGTVLIAVSFLIPYFFVTGPGVGDYRGGSEVNSTEQIVFILSHPIQYIQILGSFLLTYLSPGETYGYIASYAYLSNASHLLWVPVFGAFCLTALTDKTALDKDVCTWKTRLFAGIIFLGTAVLVVTALYVSYTAVGSDTVAGCQPRYLIPMLFGLLIFLSSPRLEWPKSSKGKAFYNGSILAVMACANMIGFWQVYVAFLH